MLSGTIPIFTYHSLDDSGSVISTSPSAFRAQMTYLRENGFKSLPLSEIVDLVYQKNELPQRTFAVTFDDGYENIYAEAMPVLSDFGFKATVFLVADYCGRTNMWPGHSSAIGNLPLLTWSQVTEMHEHGVEAGSHTLSHPDLTRIPMGRAKRELAESKLTIENRIGVEVTLFAYPNGRYNSGIKKLVSQLFRGACSTNLGKVVSGCDPYLLKRIDTSYLRNTRLFKRLANREFDWYMALRQAGRVIKGSVDGR